MEYNNRNSYHIYGNSSYHSASLLLDLQMGPFLVISSPVTKVTAININCIEPVTSKAYPAFLFDS